MQILVDGVDIEGKYSRISVTQDRDAPHNNIKIDSFTPELFSLIDPRINPGTHRITLNHEGQPFYFLLEPPITGDETNFSFGGRSLSAVEEELYVGEQITVDLYGLSEENRAASVVAASVLTERPLDWQIPGPLYLSETYSFTGSPLDCVRDIASKFGGIVRNTQTGSIRVVKYYEVDPRNITTANFTLDADDDIADNVGYEEVDGLKKNAVIVRSPAEYESPAIEWEGSYEQWETAYLRVFWDKPEEKQDPDTSSTSGTLEKDDPFITTAQYTPQVNFQDGVANVSNAIQTLDSVTWEGLDGGTPDWEVGGTELRISGIGGIATITYTAKFQRWKLTGANNENVLIGFGDPINKAVAFDFRFAGATELNYLDDIEDANISTQAAGQSRAEAELFATADKRYLDIEIDMRGRVITDGMVCQLTGEIMGLTGFFFVQQANMDIREIGMTYKLRLEKWLE